MTSHSAIDSKGQEWRHDETSSASPAAYVPGSDAEKHLLRKIDMRIVPTIFLLFV
jgi:hypothetical protein